MEVSSSPPLFSPLFLPIVVGLSEWLSLYYKYRFSLLRLVVLSSHLPPPLYHYFVLQSFQLWLYHQPNLTHNQIQTSSARFPLLGLIQHGQGKNTFRRIRCVHSTIIPNASGMDNIAAAAVAKGGGPTTMLSSFDNLRAFPDLELPVPPGQAPIYIFGVVHGEMDASGAADFIFSSRPAAVVCETSLTPAHGAATGSVLRLEDCLSPVGSGYGGSGDARARYLAQIAARLDTAMFSSSPLPSVGQENDDGDDNEAWSQLCAHTPSEQLAYIATLAVGADLIFGDRPKTETYARLLWVPSLVDLDRAFGAKARENYEELAGELWPGGGDGEVEGGGGGDGDGDGDSLVVHRILMLERDARLLSTLNNASIKAGPQSLVVGVVGRGHLPGMADLWENNTWQDLLTTPPMDSNTSGDDDDNDSKSEEYGVRRALFDGILRLTCQSDVLDDVASKLPDLNFNFNQGSSSSSSPAWEAYHTTHEIYGNCRMLLATLSTEELKAVCQGWRCDMYGVLEEVRKVRPVNGGKGWSEELVTKLRMLNFELAVQGEEE